MVVNDGCGLQYNRANDCGCQDAWERRRETLNANGSACKVSESNPFLSVRSMVTNAMVVKYD